MYQPVAFFWWYNTSVSAEFFQLRDLTPEENSARIMGILERNIRMEAVISKGLSAINEMEKGVVPQDWIDGVDLARRLERHIIAITYGDILDNGNAMQQQMARRYVQLNEARITHPPVTVFDAKALGSSLAKFVMEYQAGEYEDTSINPNPPNRNSD